jgi:hypothetical protein
MTTSKRKVWLACWAAIGVLVGVAHVPAVQAGEAIVVGSEQKLDRILTAQVLTTVGDDGQAAVVWTRESDQALKGRRWAGPSGTAVPINLAGSSSRLLRAEFGPQNDLRVAFLRAADATAIEVFDAAGSLSGPALALPGGADAVDFLANEKIVQVLGESSQHGSEVTIDVYDEHGAARAHAGYALGDDLLRTVQLSAHGDEFLLGVSLARTCGNGKSETRSVVTRWNEDAETVRNPRRFAAARCGDPAKLLRFLDGPTEVGSLAVLQDRSARRFISGTPPPSELEFSFPIAASEEMLAFASNRLAGRFVVVTRTAASDRPVRLFAQLFGRDGRPRGGKVDLGAAGVAGSEPVAAVALADSGTAWVAYSRKSAAAAANQQGLFLRRVGFFVP